MPELQEGNTTHRYFGIPTTEAERALKRTDNSKLPITLQSEAFD